MKKSYGILASLFLICQVSIGYGAIVTTQGFEAAAQLSGGDDNYDLAATSSANLGLGSSIVLPNTDDDGTSVDLTFATGATLGYSTTYTNSRDGVGLSDGDFIGPTSFTGDVGAFSEGVAGFQFDDADGLLTVQFDTLDISSFTAGVTVSLDYFIEDSGYESDDQFTIQVDVDGSVTNLVSLGETELEATPEQWITTTSATLTGNNLIVRVLGDNNAGSETYYIDALVINSVPEPSSLAFLGLAISGLALRRRRS